MDKQETIDEITDEIKDAIVAANEQRDRYGKILARLLNEPNVSTSDLDPIGSRVFHLLVCADMIAMDAVRKNMPAEFLQHLADNLDGYAQAYRIAVEKASVAAAQEAWPKNLIVH